MGFGRNLSNGVVLSIGHDHLTERPDRDTERMAEGRGQANAVLKPGCARPSDGRHGRRRNDVEGDGASEPVVAPPHPIPTKVAISQRTVASLTQRCPALSAGRDGEHAAVRATRISVARTRQTGSDAAPVDNARL